MTRQPTVLLLAADGLTRLITANGLSMYGFEVTTVAEGEAALAALESGQRIDVLVTDAELGGAVDGLAVAREARRLQPRIDVIYTARAPFRIPEKAKVAGAPCIRTPYLPQQIVGIISELRHRPPATEIGRRVA